MSNFDLEQHKKSSHEAIKSYVSELAKSHAYVKPVIIGESPGNMASPYLNDPAGLIWTNAILLIFYTECDHMVMEKRLRNSQILYIKGDNIVLRVIVPNRLREVLIMALMNLLGDFIQKNSEHEIYADIPISWGPSSSPKMPYRCVCRADLAEHSMRVSLKITPEKVV